MIRTGSRTRARITALALCIVSVFCLSSCQKGQKQAAGGKKFVIGYSQAGPSIYYQLSGEGCKAAGKVAGAEVIVLNAGNSAEKELAIVEDFIAKKVDAIVVFTLNAASAQKEAQLANRAGIPFFVIGSGADLGPGKVTSTIKGNFLSAGRMIGEYIAKTHPNQKLAMVEGMYGQNIAELFTQGIEEKIAGSGIEVVAKHPTDWTRLRAISVTQDIITAHPETEVLWVNWEDGCAGAIQALREAGVLDKIAVITHNGQKVGEKMLREGEIEATNANSPTMEAAVAMKVVLDHLNGREAPAEVETPTKMITLENIDEIYGWETERSTELMKRFLAEPDKPIEEWLKEI